MDQAQAQHRAQLASSCGWTRWLSGKTQEAALMLPVSTMPFTAAASALAGGPRLHQGDHVSGVPQRGTIDRVRMGWRRSCGSADAVGKLNINFRGRPCQFYRNETALDWGCLSDRVRLPCLAPMLFERRAFRSSRHARAARPCRRELRGIEPPVRRGWRRRRGAPRPLRRAPSDERLETEALYGGRRRLQRERPLGLGNWARDGYVG